MPLENATTISQLDATWPLGLDSASRGDDHLRLLKAVLKAQFPGASGQGFSKPITVKEDDLNGLPARVDGLANKFFPVGTVVLRMDATNPGSIYGGTWNLITGDAALSFGNGAAQSGGVSGNNNPGVPLPEHSHGAGHNLSLGNSGNHQHGFTAIQYGGGNHIGQGSNVIGGQGSATDWAGDHNHPIYGGIQISNAGTPGATIDVRGGRIAINVWRRTA